MELKEAIKILRNYNDLHTDLNPLNETDKTGENTLWTAIRSVVVHFDSNCIHEFEQIINSDGAPVNKCKNCSVYTSVAC